MQLQIQFPDTFPLHGIERDAFETKLRDALHCVFDGRRVRQLAEQVDVRRPFEPSDVLPLRRFDDISVGLRRVLMNAVGARLGLELTEPGIAASLAAGDANATNRLPPQHPPSSRRAWAGPVALAIAAGTAVGVLGAATTAWKISHPAATARMVAAFVSTSPARLRDMASSVPDDGRAYRISAQVEPQGTDAGSH